MASDATSNTLRRVAHALGVPVNAFSDPSVKHQIGSVAQGIQDSSEMLAIFAKIEDPQVRRECIEFVRSKMSYSSQTAFMPPVAD